MQFWVLDVLAIIRLQARRQPMAIATRVDAGDDQAFVDVACDWDTQ